AAVCTHVQWVYWRSPRSTKRRSASAFGNTQRKNINNLHQELFFRKGSMITDASVENYYITKIREQFPDFKIPPRAPTLTLYDALDALSLYRFKDLLEKTGMIDLLKQPSFLMLIAPIDAAFDVIDPLVRQELEGEYASARLNTLARTHIVPATTLFRESGESIEPNCDMNGALLNVQVTAIKDFVGSVIPPRYFINAVQGVRPFEPSPIGSLRVANGNIILVPKVLIGKTLLEQKYRDMYRRFFQTGEESTKYTSWEALKNVGLTQFCNLIERAGFIELLNSPAENQQKLRVLAPIDEA